MTRTIAAILAIAVYLASASAAIASLGIEQWPARALMTRLDAMLAAATALLGRAVPREPVRAVLWLHERGIVERADIRGGGEPATRGYASLLFMRVLHEDGNLLFRLAPRSERLAYQHFKFLRLIPAGGASVPITGPELWSLTSLARARLAHRQARR